MAKDFAKALYNSKEWQAIRDYIMKRDKYLCQQIKNGHKCGDPAEEVHHKIPLTPENISNPEIALGEGNLISLCRDCHCRQHDKDRVQSKDVGEEYYFDSNGYLQKVIKE